VPWHGTHGSTVQHDDGLARIGDRSLVRPFLGSHGLRRRLPVGCLESQSDGMGAQAYALVVRRRHRQQSLKDPGRLTERGARPEFGLRSL